MVVLGHPFTRRRNRPVLVHGSHDVGPPAGAGSFELDAETVTCGARLGVFHASMMRGKAGPRKAAGRRDVWREGCSRPD